MVLDRLWRPGNWAARAAFASGLQGGRPVAVDEHLIPVRRAPGTPPLRIAFASDFHAGPTTDDAVLRSACERLAELEPDLILLGGDFVTVRAGDIRRLAPMLAEVHAPLGKFGVFGNHDLRANHGILRSALERAGVDMLDNERLRLPAPHGDITLIGLDDPIRGTPEGGLLDEDDDHRIVLMHAPDGLLSMKDRHFDLALCGHTHGGQVVLPWGTAPYLPAGKLSRKYSAGLYRLGDRGERALLVSRGVGCSTIPFRVWSQAEVHLLTLG